MTKKDEEKIFSLLRSGDFTIASHDYSECDLYKGKHEYDDLPEKSFYTFNMQDNAHGYMPLIMQFLISSLGGKWDSA